MKLQKQKVRQSKLKEYFKWVVVIPQERVNQLGWKEGIELHDEIKDNHLLLRPAMKSEICYL